MHVPGVLRGPAPGRGDTCLRTPLHEATAVLLRSYNAIGF